MVFNCLRVSVLGVNFRHVIIHKRPLGRYSLNMNRKIFSVLGVLPEPGGYAIAKFSRTAVYKSYQDWVMELTEEGAEKFYDSFYFQYGHGIIADLAHLMVVFKNISVAYQEMMKKAEEAYYKIEEKHPGVGQYVLPQATRRRFLMRMSPWELQYIAELRTRPSGHQSYREITFQMYQEFAKKYPSRAKHFRVVSPDIVDFFKR